MSFVVTVAFGYGSIMVLTVSLLSLLGLLIVPLVRSQSHIGQIAYKHVLTLLIAMGASALVSDALFELLPTVRNYHQFVTTSFSLLLKIFHIGHSHGIGPLHDEQDHVWKVCGVLAGILIFYIFELILHILIKVKNYNRPK